ncbi:MAG: HesA/MoeB/ThiF family protein [Actinomycetota bacterium]
MTLERYSAAIGGRFEADLRKHLERPDGQEDLCFVTWRPSTGNRRQTALIIEPLLPQAGERHVHGNASFESVYALRAVKVAAQRQEGLAFVHSHPAGARWQPLNDLDARAEALIANLAREMTGLPLVGMTLAGSDGSWSARVWDTGSGGDVGYTSCESVRVVGEQLRLTFNDELRPRPRPQQTQQRTIHAWGEELQADLARLRVLVAGAGSVGLHIAESLARTGIEHIGVMDFDRVEFVNLDRLHGATHLDALLRRSKIDVARRILRRGATAEVRIHDLLEASVCEPAGLEALLDFDVVFSCVDRPWPRHVLNTVAYADLIPVIDGGLRLEPRPGGGMRNAYWRSQVVTAGRPCLACIGQYDPAHVQLERDGSLDSPSYVAGIPAESPLRANQNVSALSIAAASTLLTQFLSLVIAPGGMGDPGPLRHGLATHRIEHLDVSCVDDCPYSKSVGDGDGRLDPTAPHPAAEQVRGADRVGMRALRFGINGMEGVASGAAAMLSRFIKSHQADAESRPVG